MFDDRNLTIKELERERNLNIGKISHLREILAKRSAQIGDLKNKLIKALQNNAELAKENIRLTAEVQRLNAVKDYTK